MDKEIAISVQNASKSFKLPHEKYTGLKQAAVNFRPGRKFEQQHVLKNISFDINKGEFFGIVGRNGSGKSTLLKVLAQIYTPEKGGVAINGTLTPFIELGVGFNPELTGRENVYLNGALLGFDRKQMDEMYHDIVSFAEIENFMDQKLKNYSSGMQVRLAFSIAIRAKSDILLIDEVLAVGDALFQKKCYEYFRELKQQGRTVVFVSHDTGALEEYCDRGILVESGDILFEGTITDVITQYNKTLSKNVSDDGEDTSENSKSWGSGAAIVNEVSINGLAKQQKAFRESDTIGISVSFKALRNIESPVCGITITDIKGTIIFQSNTLWLKKPIKDMGSGEIVTINWKLPNYLNTGTYYISPAISDRFGIEVYNWVDTAAKFDVIKKQKSHGVVNVEHELLINYE